MAAAKKSGRRNYKQMTTAKEPPCVQCIVTAIRGLEDAKLPDDENFELEAQCAEWRLFTLLVGCYRRSHHCSSPVCHFSSLLLLLLEKSTRLHWNYREMLVFYPVVVLFGRVKMHSKSFPYANEENRRSFLFSLSRLFRCCFTPETLLCISPKLDATDIFHAIN